MTTIAIEGRFDSGRMIRRGLRIIRQQPVEIGLLAIVSCGAPALLTGWAEVSVLGVTAAPDQPLLALSRIGQFEGIAIVAVAITYVAQGGAAVVMGDFLAERPATLARTLASTVGSLPSILALGLIAIIATILGYILLIVPGILISLAWAVAGPASAVEGKGAFAALARSAQLTRGHRGIIFVLTLGYFIAVAAIGLLERGLVGAPLAGPQAFAPLQTLVAQPILQTVTGGVLASMVASTYWELREIKEGAASGVARVFE